MTTGKSSPYYKALSSSNFNSTDNKHRYWMTVDSLTLNNPDGNKTTFPSFTAMAHSTDQLSYLPRAAVDAIALAFDIHNTTEDEWYVIPCSYASINGSLDLQFGSLNINVPYADLITTDTSGGPGYYECYLAVMHWDDTNTLEKQIDYYYLGHPFLRSAYSVFDQDGRNVWLAQQENCGTDIVEITTDSGSIAGMTGQCAGNSSSGSGTASDDGSGGPKNSGPRLGASTAALVIAMNVGFMMGL
jgi:hypothetical protein